MKDHFTKEQIEKLEKAGKVDAESLKKSVKDKKDKYINQKPVTK